MHKGWLELDVEDVVKIMKKIIIDGGDDHGDRLEIAKLVFRMVLQLWRGTPMEAGGEADTISLSRGARGGYHRYTVPFLGEHKEEDAVSVGCSLARPLASARAIWASEILMKLCCSHELLDVLECKHIWIAFEHSEQSP